MSDLVKRLRAGPYDRFDHRKNQELEAADRIEALEAVMNYVADMTYCGTDAEWHFKPGYDPQRVLDASSWGRPPSHRSINK